MKRLLLLLVAALAIAACGPAGSGSGAVGTDSLSAPTGPLDSTLESMPVESASTAP